MNNKTANNKNPFPHDHFVRKVLSEPRYCLDVFKLILSKKQMALFDWETLKTELSSTIDEKGKEKRMDLLVSVLRKDTRRPNKILFLMEHKSHHDPKLLLQFLRYQTEIYQNSSDPIIPVLINQSQNKIWKGPLNFHDYLQDFDGEFREYFREYVLFFTALVLNIGNLNIPRDTKGLTIQPIVYILQNIWKINQPRLAEVFRLSKDLGLAEREKVMGWVTNYVKQYDPSFTWKDIKEAEKRAYPKKEDRVMITIIEEARAEAKQEGRQEGIKQGITIIEEARAEAKQEGRQEGIKQGITIIEEAKAEAKQEGHRKGRMERDQEVILNMLKENTDIAFISKVTGMPKEEIEKLKNGSSDR